MSQASAIFVAKFLALDFTPLLAALEVLGFTSAGIVGWFKRFPIKATDLEAPRFRVMLIGAIFDTQKAYVWILKNVI